MLKSEHFVTISLETNECDICHQCTGEILVTCKQCFQPATEETVREGFNQLLGVVHQDHIGHEACFAKAHQVLNQNFNIGNRKLSSDSVTSQLKGLLDGKFQQIMKYARNDGNLSIPQPLLVVKSTPSSRTSSPMRSMSNTRIDHATKRKCNSDENLALRQSRRPAFMKANINYDREKCERITQDNKTRQGEPIEHAPTGKNSHIRQADYKMKNSYLHDPKFVKMNCAVHRECQEAASRETIKIPSDRLVYLPCEHQYASEGWTVDDLICDFCKQHHHRTHQSERLIASSSQSESSTDNDLDYLLPVTKSVANSSNKEYLRLDFKIYSSEELKLSSGNELCELLEKLKTTCTDISSKLVVLLQERDELKQEVKVRHLMIEKLVSIQSTE